MDGNAAAFLDLQDLHEEELSILAAGARVSPIQSPPQASGSSSREPSLQRLQDAETLLQSLLDLSQDRAAGDGLWSCLPRPPVKIKNGGCFFNSCSSVRFFFKGIPTST